MRNSFIEALVAMAQSDPRIVLLTADLGYTVMEPFSERFPERFFNVGISEQNMVGMATGLAEAGFIPYVYSIASFMALRPYEFIRLGPAHHRLPVRIVGVGGGFDYGHNGISHYALEDFGLMRMQPEIAVVAPADCCQAHSAVLATKDFPGPVYYRLGKNNKNTIPGLDGRFELGGLQQVREGGDALLLATGSIAFEAIAAAATLAREGIECTVMIVACLAPAPEDALAAALSRFDAALTIEGHGVTGGLGSLVSEVVAERGIPCKIHRFGVRQSAAGVIGSQPFMHHMHQMDAAALVDRVREVTGRAAIPTRSGAGTNGGHD